MSLDDLQDRLGYRFADRGLLDLALSRRSWAQERVPVAADNERLEFLGDAVLKLVVSRWLYDERDGREGELSELRDEVIKGSTLTARAQGLGLAEVLRLGRGEEADGGRQRPAALEDVFEAVTGAIYLDGGLSAARGFLLRVLGADLARGEVSRNPKTALQEFVQGRGESTPRYVTVDTSGPPHQPVFRRAVFVGERCLGEGRGRSKKAADLEAARAALAAVDTEGADG